MWATAAEAAERFLMETFERFYPADPGDVRFEFGMYEDAECPYWAKVIDDKGDVVETHGFFTTSERLDMVEAWRDAQARRAEADRLGVHPLEIEFAPFGEAWEREQHLSRFAS